MYSVGAIPKLLGIGFPIRRSTDQRLLTAPRGLSQFCHVLHRLLVPRHPPNALTSLTTENLWFHPSLAGRPERAGKRSSHGLRSPWSAGGLILADRSNIPDASVMAIQLSRAVDMTSWVSCELARPSECVASRRLQADRADATHSVSCFTLRSTMEFS